MVRTQAEIARIKNVSRKAVSLFIANHGIKPAGRRGKSWLYDCEAEPLASYTAAKKKQTAQSIRLKILKNIKSAGGDIAAHEYRLGVVDALRYITALAPEAVHIAAGGLLAELPEPPFPKLDSILAAFKGAELTKLELPEFDMSAFNVADNFETWEE